MALNPSVGALGVGCRKAIFISFLRYAGALIHVQRHRGEYCITLSAYNRIKCSSYRYPAADHSLRKARHAAR